MNRRTYIRKMLYIAGGTLILPACVRQSGRLSIELVNLTISEADEEVLETLVETIIPTSDTPGGRELLLHLFVLKMMDDCHGPADQQSFVDGLKAFADLATEALGGLFVHAEKEKREIWLERIVDKDEDSVKKFISLVKRRTIQGYMNSQYVMTNLIKYELVPGRYNGYFPIERIDHVPSNIKR